MTYTANVLMIQCPSSRANIMLGTFIQLSTDPLISKCLKLNLPFQNFLYLFSFVPSLMTLSLPSEKLKVLLGLCLLSNQSLSPVNSVLLQSILSIPVAPSSLPVSWFSLTPSASLPSLCLPHMVFFYCQPWLVNFLLETSNDFLLPGEKKSAPWAIDQCLFEESMSAQKNENSFFLNRGSYCSLYWA